MLPKSIKIGPHGLLGGSWGPSWPQEPKSFSKVRSSPSILGSLLGGWRDLVGPKNHQKANQNASKILIDFDIHFSTFFDRLGSDFGGVLEANLASKMIPRCIKNCTPILSDFFIDL